MVYMVHCRACFCSRYLLSSYIIFCSVLFLSVLQVSKRLEKTARYFKNLGTLAFWSQLVCTTVSAGILSFSAVATGNATSPFTFYATGLAIVAAFMSVFRSFGYIRLSKTLRRTATEPAKVLKFPKECPTVLSFLCWKAIASTHPLPLHIGVCAWRLTLLTCRQSTWSHKHTQLIWWHIWYRNIMVQQCITRWPATWSVLN